MPFASEKQRRWMHAAKPAMAKKWEREEKMNERKPKLKKETAAKAMKAVKTAKLHKEKNS